MNYNIKLALTCDVVGQADVMAISGYTPLNPSKDGCTGTRGFRVAATDPTDIGSDSKKGTTLVCLDTASTESGHLQD
jgi:hypothetical protein